MLIHGGAGGVGWRQFRSLKHAVRELLQRQDREAKRDLLRALGVTHVFDSRSTAFVDEVRRLTGEGVDVVLNSLAGEAMERSVACLRRSAAS